jgi:hypothetical protein
MSGVWSYYLGLSFRYDMCIMNGWRYGRVDPVRRSPRIGERDDLELDAINEVVQHIAAREVAQSASTV